MEVPGEVQKHNTWWAAKEEGGQNPENCGLGTEPPKPNSLQFHKQFNSNFFEYTLWMTRMVAVLAAKATSGTRAVYVPYPSAVGC